MNLTDEKLIAYLLDELDEDERANVDDALAQDEEAQAKFEALQKTILLTRETLAIENAVLDDARRDLVLVESRSTKLNQISSTYTGPRRRFSLSKWTAATLLAASLLVAAFVYLQSLGAQFWTSEYSTSANGADVAAPVSEDFEIQQTIEANRLQRMTRESAPTHPPMVRDAFGPGVAKEQREVLESLGYIDGDPVRTAPTRTNRSNLASTHEYTGDMSRSWNDASSPGNETYADITETGFREAQRHPLSTFSIDVDTASYANVRRMLNAGQLPPPNAVRIEEFINYFDYDYRGPRGDAPFSANVEIADCPWSPQHRLARIGLKGREIRRASRPPANLVFLLDVSGSMDQPNKLPLVKESMKLLVNELDERDYITIAVYAGSSGLVLPATRCDDKRTIVNALDRLKAGGSTNGGEGIHLAYAMAQRNFLPEGANRVILATDGDFNVGTTDREALIRLIEDRAKSGVFLTTLGFGMGNLKDATLEGLADRGNGNYAYIDTLNEAAKILVDELTSTLVTIAKDVKIQVEFNPAQVRAYRLIGYENRALAARDFNDDTKDAGEIGAGHTVTALYEIVPWGVEPPRPAVDPLKYQNPAPAQPASVNNELMTVKLRYKEPDGDVSKLLEFPVVDEGASLASATPDFKFAAAVAGFGMILRHSQYKGDATLDSVLELAQSGQGPDEFGYRAEFIELARGCRPLLPPTTATDPYLEVLSIQLRGNGRPVAQIITRTDTRWISEGEAWEHFQLLAIDPQNAICLVLDTDTQTVHRLTLN